MSGQSVPSAATYTLETLHTGGELIAQAPVSSSVVVVPVPNDPPPNGTDYYPKKGQFPSAVYRGQLLFTELGKTYASSAGGSAEGCFSSFSNQPHPEKGREDEWCEGYGFRGLAKNTMTDVEGGFLGWQSNYRGGNRKVATLCAGGTTIPYTGTEKVRIGSPIIFLPPPVKQPAEYGRNEQPVAGMGPLDRSVLKTRLVPNIHVAMLEKQKSKLANLRSASWNRVPSPELDSNGRRTSGMWNKAADAKHKAIMLHVIAGIHVLAGRGMVEIISPAKSRERAVGAWYDDRIKKAIRDRKSSGELNQLLDEKEAALGRAREEGEAASRASSAVAPGFRRNIGNDGDGDEFQFDDDQYVVYDRDVANWDIAWSNARSDDVWFSSQLLEESKFFDDLQWLAKGMGVGSKERNREPEFDAAQLDVLLLVSIGCISAKEYEQYFNKVSDTILGEEKKALHNFKMELKDALGDEEMTSGLLNESLSRRIIGTAMGAVSNPSGSHKARTLSSTQIDILVGTPIV